MRGCRQPAALDVTEPRTPWALAWAGRNLLHLHLADSQAANLHWIPGILSHRACRAVVEVVYYRPGWFSVAQGRRVLCGQLLIMCDDCFGVLSAPGLRQLQCLSLRGCARLSAGALGSLATLQHLRSLDLAGLPLLQVAFCCHQCYSGITYHTELCWHFLAAVSATGSAYTVFGLIAMLQRNRRLWSQGLNLCVRPDHSSWCID